MSVMLWRLPLLLVTYAKSQLCIGTDAYHAHWHTHKQKSCLSITAMSAESHDGLYQPSFNCSPFYLSACLLACLPVCLSVHPFICLLPACLSVSGSVCLSVCLSVHVSIPCVKQVSHIQGMCFMWWRRATSPSMMMMRMSWHASARAPALESWHCSDRCTSPAHAAST